MKKEKEFTDVEERWWLGQVLVNISENKSRINDCTFIATVAVILSIIVSGLTIYNCLALYYSK